jgi:acetyl esterase/lipase
MKLNKLFIFTSLILLLASCKKTDSGSGITIAAKTMLDVAYGTDPLQKMDIYLPANRSVTSTKVIVLIHGGAWTSGDKVDFNSAVDTLKKDYLITLFLILITV